MENNKRQTIFLSVIGIATLLVAVLGATYAWFSTTLSGTGASTQVTTATISNLRINSTSITAPTGKILPGWESTAGSIGVGVVAGGSISVGTQIKFDCYVWANRANANLQYAVTGADNSTYGTWTNINATANNVQKIVTAATLTNSNTSDAYGIKIRFKETGSNQNTLQGQTLTVNFSCALAGGTVYYNNANPSGTTVMPSTQ